LRLWLQPVAVFFASLLFSGCASSHPKSGSSEPGWAGAPSSANEKQLVGSFNRYLEKRRGPASPTQLALEFVRADRTQAARTRTEAVASPEGGGPTTVRVVQDGLADDSVRATRHVLSFVRAGRGWRLKSAARTQRCRPGRGHESFAAADCV
jgi:hypothetical protein